MNQLTDKQTFYWSGVDALGLPQRGRVEASSYQHAAALVGAQGIVVNAMKEVDTKTRPQLSKKAPPRVGRQEQAFFSRQLAGLLAAGIPISHALEAMVAGSKPAMRHLLKSLHQCLEEGMTLSDALARHANSFDGCYLALIRCGENSGQLAPALSSLATQAERTQHLHGRIQQALLQPGLILLTAAAASWLLLAFVMPEFAAMYGQQGHDLPIITQWVIGLSDQLLECGWIYLVVLAVAFAAGTSAYQRLPAVALMLDRCFLAIPLLGSLPRAANITSMCRTLAGMVAAGIPLSDGLPLAADACSNRVFRRAVKHLGTQLANGNSLSDAMAASMWFPKTLQKMVRLGEETGNLEHMLTQANSIYEYDLERTLSQLLPLIEPLLMIVLGMIIGGLILAMYLPIFSLGNLFHSMH